MTGDRGYLAFVISEPIKGIPSHRIYGTYATSDLAWAALEEAGVIVRAGIAQKLGDGWAGGGVLPMRDPATLKNERP